MSSARVQPLQSVESGAMPLSAGPQLSSKMKLGGGGSKPGSHTNSPSPQKRGPYSLKAGGTSSNNQSGSVSQWQSGNSSHNANSPEGGSVYGKRRSFSHQPSPKDVRSSIPGSSNEVYSAGTPPVGRTSQSDVAPVVSRPSAAPGGGLGSPNAEEQGALCSPERPCGKEESGGSSGLAPTTTLQEATVTTASNTAGSSSNIQRSGRQPRGTAVTRKAPPGGRGRLGGTRTTAQNRSSTTSTSVIRSPNNSNRNAAASDKSKSAIVVMGDVEIENLEQTTAGVSSSPGQQSPPPSTVNISHQRKIPLNTQSGNPSGGVPRTGSSSSSKSISQNLLLPTSTNTTFLPESSTSQRRFSRSNKNNESNSGRVTSPNVNTIPPGPTGAELKKVVKCSSKKISKQTIKKKKFSSGKTNSKKTNNPSDPSPTINTTTDLDSMGGTDDATSKRFQRALCFAQRRGEHGSPCSSSSSSTRLALPSAHNQPSSSSHHPGSGGVEWTSHSASDGVFAMRDATIGTNLEPNHTTSNSNPLLPSHHSESRGGGASSSLQGVTPTELNSLNSSPVAIRSAALENEEEEVPTSHEAKRSKSEGSEVEEPEPEGSDSDEEGGDVEDDDGEEEDEEEEDEDEEGTSDDESESDEEDEDSDEGSDDVESTGSSQASSPQKKRNQKKKRVKLQLKIKISREGDANIKAFTLLHSKTAFRKLVSEVMTRFNYEEPEDFDLFRVDVDTGERVDVDLRRDFEELTAPYWERIEAAAATAVDGPEGESEISGPSGSHRFRCHETKEQMNHHRSRAVPRKNSGTASRTRQDPSAPQQQQHMVLRLYVRESYSYRQRHPNFIALDAGSSLIPSIPLASLSLSTKENLLPNSGSGLNNTLNSLHYTQNGPFSSRAHSSTVCPSQMNSNHHNSTMANTVYGNLSFRSTTADAPRPQFKEGKIIQWSKMRVIGKGSFGTVYEGMTSDGKLVAVKVQEIPLETEEAKEMKQVQEEINLMRMLEHRHIVAYYGCQIKPLDTGAAQMEIFLELCHGGSLAALRRRFEKAKEPFKISLVRTYIKQVLLGLEYLHARKVSHRDLKSDNVLISALGEAKLSDFGCSKRISTASMGQNTGGGDARRGSAEEQSAGARRQQNRGVYHTMVGSPIFMAPEVMNSTTESGGYTHSADIWSLGCMVLELLGRDPWEEAAGHQKEGKMNMFKLLFLISKSTGMPTGVPKNCPPLLLDFFTHCFDRDPSTRWSATKLLQHAWMTCDDDQLQEVPEDME